MSEPLIIMYVRLPSDSLSDVGTNIEFFCDAIGKRANKENILDYYSSIDDPTIESLVYMSVWKSIVSSLLETLLSHAFAA